MTQPKTILEALKTVPLDDAGWHHFPALRGMIAEAVAKRDTRTAVGIAAAIDAAAQEALMLAHDPNRAIMAEAVAAFVFGSGLPQP